MPLDQSLYDWVIQKEYFKVTRKYQKEGKFIQKFSSASIIHWHFENGVIIDQVIT